MRLINRHPGRPGWMMLAILPFALLLMLYLAAPRSVWPRTRATSSCRACSRWPMR